MNETRAAVLAAIDDDGPVGGPELADRLDVSRTAVWKHVEALRDAGFEIESGDDGYRLLAIPDSGGPAVASGLGAPYRIEYPDAIGSTNDRARELATDGEHEVVVLADEQTGGRGRLEREWASPSGGIWCSIVIRPDWPAAAAPRATLAAAVAVTGALAEAGVDAGIKWPNDVLAADGRKLAGILTEMEGEADRIRWLVVGIGLNAAVDPDALPETAASVVEYVDPVDRRRLTQGILERFAALVADPDGILPAWREHADTLGRRVGVDTPGGRVEGVAVDVVEPGALVLETDDGERTVHAGDCEHLRPVE